MRKFEEYIDDKSIIFYLCRIRAKIAKNRNKMHLIHLISSDPNLNYHKRSITSSEKEICDLFPSRKKWRKIGKAGRYRNGKKLNSIEKNIHSLQITIDWYRKNDPSADFLQKLDTFIADIKNCIKDTNYTISTPITYPKKKDNIKREKTKCRPISIFNLQDRIVICLVNKYFTDLFDSFFYCNSMAFRAVKRVDGKNRIVTHHDAIKEIVEYKQKNGCSELWVSECDMKKFYDTVNHTVIKKYFKTFINRIKKNHSMFYSEDAERIFYRYLDCYTFNKTVFPYNKSQKYFSDNKITNGTFEWVENDLLKNHYKKLGNAKIGVPQGGALSGLIANIVLHYSDEIIAKRGDSNLLYLRYCDDMIIMHPDKEVCQAATIDYKNSLFKLKLVPHDFQDIAGYDKSFWNDKKSKKPYQWGDYCTGKVPWIGFVGYEINTNCEIRIRNHSLKKEMSKQLEVIQSARSAIKLNNKKAPDKYIEESILYRLIGMSIGRVTLWNYQNSVNDLCWINGFSQLNINPTVSVQLKRLDKNRNKYFNQFCRELKTIRGIESERTLIKSNRQIIYHGKPFSYYYHVCEKSR